MASALKDIPLNTEVYTKAEVDAIVSGLNATIQGLVTSSYLTTALAGKLDAPSGGTAGNVLKKTSTGTEWATDNADLLRKFPTATGYLRDGIFYSTVTYDSTTQTATYSDPITPIDYGIYEDRISLKLYQYMVDQGGYVETPFATAEFMSQAIAIMQSDVSHAASRVTSVNSSVVSTDSD